MENDEKCSKCHDTGMIKEKDGTIHVCWICLSSGRLDVHSKDLKENNIRL